MTTPSSLKKILLISAAAASAVAMSAQAKTSSLSEMRGYEACVEAAGSEFDGLALSRIYYINEESDKNVYYVNGSAWEAGERVSVRLSCDTSKGGHQVLSANSNLGRYSIERGRTTIEVAAN